MSTKKIASERYNEILDVTISIMAFEGQASATMRSISKRLGIRLSTLQYYFPNKRELLKSAIEKCIASMDRKKAAIAKRGKLEPNAQLIKSVRVHLAASRDPLVAGFFTGLWGLAVHDNDAKELLNELYERDLDHFRENIARANSRLSSQTCHSRAVLLLSQIEGLTLFVSPGKSSAPMYNELEKELIRIVETAILTS